MFDAYYPNSFRLEQLEDINHVIDFNPKYSVHFDMNRNEHFQALQAVNLSLLLEGLLLYDRIYVDVLEFPLYVSAMASIDVLNTAKILNNGWLSILDFPDVRPFPQYDERSNKYIWVAAGHAYENNLAIDSIKKGIKSFIKDTNKAAIIEDCLPMVLQYSKSVKAEHRALGKQLCDTIDHELKNGCYKSIGIGVLGEYYITQKNENIFFHIGNVISGDMRATKCGIKNVIRTDLQEALAKQRYVHYNIVPENFEKILHLNKLPDFKRELQEGRLKMADIIKLRESSAFNDFSQWLRTNSETNNDIAQEFIELVKNPASNSLKWKLIRLISTTGLGALPVVGGILGLGAGILDTFIVDKIVDRHEPTVFIENIHKKIDSRSNTSHFDTNQLVQIKFDDKIFIENSKEEIENENKTLKIINQKIESMKACTNDDDRYKIYLQAMDAYNKYPHPNLTVRFLFLNYLLASECPKYMTCALHCLDDFLNAPPFAFEGENLYTVGKYYFASINNALINYNNQNTSDRSIFEKQNYHCVKILFPECKIEPIGDALIELYQRVQSEFGL